MIPLSGPTVFCPILKNFIADVKSKLNYAIYNILLIFTDGEIMDQEAVH